MRTDTIAVFMHVHRSSRMCDGVSVSEFLVHTLRLNKMFRIQGNYFSTSHNSSKHKINFLTEHKYAQIDVRRDSKIPTGCVCASMLKCLW